MPERSIWGRVTREKDGTQSCSSLQQSQAHQGGEFLGDGHSHLSGTLDRTKSLRGCWLPQHPLNTEVWSVSVIRWQQKCHSHGVAEGSTDLEKPRRKPTKDTKSAVQFKCPISLLNCMLFFHWALKGAKISFFTNSQTGFKSRKLKLFIKQALGSLSYHPILFSLPLKN